jgi:hypothetical protein
VIIVGRASSDGPIGPAANLSSSTQGELLARLPQGRQQNKTEVPNDGSGQSWRFTKPHSPFKSTEGTSSDVLAINRMWGESVVTKDRIESNDLVEVDDVCIDSHAQRDGQVLPT